MAEETRESLYCIRCGACLNNCPVYRKAGGHSYGWVYSGPIGAIINPQLMGIDKAPELPYASSLCGACRDVCPVKIDFPKVLLELRHRVVEEKKKDRVGRAFLEGLAFRMWSMITANTKLYNIARTASYYLQYPWSAGKSTLKSLPYPFSRWTAARDFPAVSKTPFRSRWKDLRHTIGKGGDEKKNEK